MFGSILKVLNRILPKMIGDKMTRRFLPLIFVNLILTTLVFLTSSAFAVPRVRPGTFAPGISLGFRNAGAISLKYWYSENLAIDFNVEYLGRPFTVFYTDVHYQFPELFAKNPGFLSQTLFYVGGGLGGGTWHRDENCVRFGCSWKEETTGSGDGYFLRALTGLEWFTPKSRTGVFAELAPAYLLYPNSKIIYDFVLGARFYL